MKSERLKSSDYKEVTSTHFALRFKPMPWTNKSVSKESIRTQLGFSARKILPRIIPFVDYEEVKIPNIDLIRKYLGEDWSLFRVDGCSRCGSDITTIELGWSLASLDYHGIKTLRPFTLGHEIVAEGKVVYPLIDCAAIGLDYCSYCGQGNENMCDRLRKREQEESPSLIEGISLGFGAGILDQENGIFEDFGGGYSAFIALNKNQLFDCRASLELSTDVDSIAVSLRMLDKVLGEDESGPPKLDSASPIMIVGMGPLGLSTAINLRLRGFENVKGLVKYPVQEFVLRKLGYEAYRGDGKVGQEYPLVFDCVGSRESFKQALDLVAKEGVVAIPALPQVFAADFYLGEVKEVKIVFSFWASRGDYQKAIKIAEGFESGVNRSYGDLIKRVTRICKLSNWQSVIYPSCEVKKNFIRTVVVPH